MKGRAKERCEGRTAVAKGEAESEHDNEHGEVR
jgi:hypothetical protein